MFTILDAIVPVSSGVMAVVAILVMLSDLAKAKSETHFRRQVAAAIKQGPLTYQDLQHIAERWRQDRQKILHVLRIVLADAVSGEDDGLVAKSGLVRSLLAAHQEREPFSELPENISIQLAAIARVLNAEPDMVPQLATSLGDLYGKNQRELGRQKKLTVWGFVIGLLGLLASLPGVYSLFKP